MSFLSSDILNSCSGLKTISYLSTGLQTHGDVKEAEKLDIIFEGVKGYGDRAVAEHTIALALSSIKKIVEMDNSVRSGNWKLIRTEEINGKTFGLIGLGAIGLETAKIASALGANVIGWNRSDQALDIPIKKVSLNEVLEKSDIISLHLALNQETENFLNKSLLSKTKRGVILINTARAGIIDEKALISELLSGHIGHCAIDVFHQEPLPINHPISKMKNVTLTPHSAWLTTQSMDKLLFSGLNLLKKHIEQS
jgi:D-3-phosphoglycerate dehydrogenase